MSDYRKFPRVAITRPIRIKTSGGTVVQARMANISQGGVAITYEAPAEIGATLELLFGLPIRGRQVDFKIRAIARYNHLSSRGYIIGLEFVGLDSHESESIREFVAIKRSMKDH